MSDFSDCLEHFIREGKIDTQLLADRAGVTHATVTKYLRGKALPDRAAFQKLLHALPLTIEEQQLLSHSYYVSSIGEWTCRRRAYLQA